MLNVLKWLAIIAGCLFFLIAGAGMYKFNYLANLDGYDADGNKIEELEK